MKIGPLNISFSRAAAPVVAKDNQLASAWLRGQEPNMGAQLQSPMQQSIWVYAAISALSQMVSSIPFRISRGERNGEMAITSGPVIDLFNRPHPLMSRFRFWELITAWYCLRGEIFIAGLDKAGAPLSIRANGRQKPISLLVLPPDNFRHVIADHALAYWNFYSPILSGPMDSQIFLPEEILHDFLPNPYLFWRGLSPLSVAMLAAQTDYASAQFSKGMMLNNADNGAIIRTDQQLDETQREQLMAALKERKRAAGTADRPLLLWGGAEVIKPTLSSADMQMLENRKLNRQEICAAFFRIPQSLVGFTEDANRAIAAQERLNFIENSISTFCARIEAAVEPIIKLFGADLLGWFDIDSLPIMAEARRNRVDTGVKLFALGYPVNEINKTLDLGLPDLPWGNIGYLPFNLQEAGAGAQAAPPSPIATPAEESAFSRLCKILNGARSIAPPHICAGNPAHEAALAPRVKRMKSRVRNFLFEQRARVLAKMGKLTKGGASVHASRAIGDVFDKVSEDQSLFKKVKSLLQDDLQFGYAAIGAELGYEIFNLPPDKAIAYLKARENYLSEVNQTTFDRLMESLQEGLSGGETMTELSDRVREIFTTRADSDAETIASTEVNTAVNTARHDGMVDAGVQKRGWATAKLDNVRAAHAQAGRDYVDGIPLDEPFFVGGEKLMFPGDSSLGASAGNTINCRCFAFPIVNA